MNTRIAATAAALTLGALITTAPAAQASRVDPAASGPSTSYRMDPDYNMAQRHAGETPAWRMAGR